MNINSISDSLKFIYPEQKEYQLAYQLFNELINKYNQVTFSTVNQLTEKNVYLITYGDSFIENNVHPLLTLNKVVNEKLNKTITDIHILPMFPYTSDDGFSVVDYKKINPELGDWNDIEELRKHKRLMFDFVANHISRQNDWFKKFLSGEDEYKNSFIQFSQEFDTSNVTRPRTSPLFHTYGDKKVWTTFSDDQIDVNVQDPKMLIRLTDTLLYYCQMGASSIRLDAIGFLWKKSGTTCMHLPETHEIIKIWRKLLDAYAPNTQIITETNVPHEDNISYFGNGNNEANQVYQFTLPPLVLYSFITHNSEKLINWAKTIKPISNTATYFNFLASHDGIGLRPIEGILTEEEKNLIINRVIENGGKVSYKNNTDGTQSVYELNINYSEALKDLDNPDATTQKMIAAHHILFSMIGIPAIYYHSIFGSKNDYVGLEKSGINRRINREKLEINKLYEELETSNYRKIIFIGITKLIEIRQNEKSFNPYGNQEVVELSDKLFSLRRTYEDESILAITNLSNEEVTVKVGVSGLDLISNKKVNQVLKVSPYQSMWIKGD